MKEIAEKIRRLIDFAPHTFILYDSKLNLIDINVPGIRLWGLGKLSKKDIVGKNISHLMPELRKSKSYHKFREVLKTGKPFIAEAVPVHSKYGKKFVNLIAVKLGNGMGIIVTDITERIKAEEALRTSKERYRLLVESMSEGLIMQDEKGLITYLNDRFLEVIGYTRDEIIGHRLTDILSGERLKTYKQQIARRKKGEQGSYEIALERKDGRKVFVFVSANPLFNEDGNYKGSIAVLTDITNIRLAEQELKKSREQLRDLSLHLQSIIEDGRKQLAREIHDELGQFLTALKMDLAWLSKRLPKDHKDQELLLDKTKSMSTLIEKTMKYVQRLSSELRPGLLDDLGLVPAMEWQAQEFEKRAKIRCEMSLDSEEIDLDQDLSTVIFRIYQEALTNVARHAQATKVKVSLREKNGTLTLKIKDNGKGITKDKIYAPESLGMIGMRERISPWQGQVRITGTKDKGTTLTVTLPLRRSQGANE
jgi:two-component system sensor histidine kinase UhpB